MSLLVQYRKIKRSVKDMPEPDFVLFKRNALTQKVRVAEEDDLRPIGVDVGAKVITRAVRSSRDACQCHAAGMVLPDFALFFRNALTQEVRVTAEDDLRAIGVDFRAGAMSTAPPRGGGEARDKSWLLRNCQTQCHKCGWQSHADRQQQSLS